MVPGIGEAIQAYKVLKTIGEGRDTTGKMTEQLWQAADGSVVLIVESKQIRNGTVQLNPNGAGGYTRMSEDWIRQVITNLPEYLLDL